MTHLSSTKPVVLARLLAVAPVIVAAAGAAGAGRRRVRTGQRGRPGQRTDPNPFILAAYGFIWVAVLVYVVLVARGLGQAQGEVEALRRRVDAGK